MGYSASREAHGLANHLSAGGAWRVISVEENKNIVRSSEGMEADEYSINLNHAYSVRDELQMYSYRKTQDLPLVRIIAVDIREVPSSNDFCSGGTLILSAIVMTERIVQTLADAPQISFPEALYVMSESLMGFSELYNRVGPFEITDKMIGLTANGFVKVWMNQNFALNHPAIERLSPLQTTNYLVGDNLYRRTELCMVRNLMKEVQYHTQKGAFPNRWQLEQLSQPQMTFVDAHRLILKYIITNNIFVPDRISDGRTLRIIKTRLSNGMFIQQPTATTTVETKITNIKQQPTMVQTTTITNMPVPTQLNTIISPRNNLRPTLISTGYPSGIAVQNTKPMPVMAGGSTIIEGSMSPTSNMFAGQRPITVGGNRLGLMSPIQPFPSANNSNVMPSPPMQLPSSRRVQFQPQYVQSVIPAQTSTTVVQERIPAVPNSFGVTEIVQEETPIMNNSFAKPRQDFSGFNNNQSSSLIRTSEVRQIDQFPMDRPITYMDRPPSFPVTEPSQSIVYYKADDIIKSNDPALPMSNNMFTTGLNFNNNNNGRQDSVLLSRLSSEQSSMIRPTF